MLRILMLTCLALALCACGGDDPQGEAPAKAGPPTKEDVVALLRTLESAVAKGDLDAAMACMVPFGGAKPADIPPFVKREGLTEEAIDTIATEGTFGTFNEVFGNRAAPLAKKAGVPVDECYAILAGGAEVAVHWDGTRIRFVRLDDLNKAR